MAWVNGLLECFSITVSVLPIHEQVAIFNAYIMIFEIAEFCLEITLHLQLIGLNQKASVRTHHHILLTLRELFFLIKFLSTFQF